MRTARVRASVAVGIASVRVHWPRNLTRSHSCHRRRSTTRAEGTKDRKGTTSSYFKFKPPFKHFIMLSRVADLLDCCIDCSALFLAHFPNTFPILARFLHSCGVGELNVTQKANLSAHTRVSWRKIRLHRPLTESGHSWAAQRRCAELFCPLCTSQRASTSQPRPRGTTARSPAIAGFTACAADRTLAQSPQRR